MEFPKLKKNVGFLLLALERVKSYSKNIALSAGLLSLTSGQGLSQPKVPIDPKLSVQKSTISKYSAKYLLRAASSSLTNLFAQHRSHSSHSSHYSSTGSGHDSHSSHVSHYSSSSPSPLPSHSSHYSGSAPPIRTTPSLPSHSSHYSGSNPPTRTNPSSSESTMLPNTSLPGETGTSTVVLSDYFDDAVRAVIKWKLGCLTAGPNFTDKDVTVVERNASLEITPRAGVSTRSYNGYITQLARDFTASHARVDVFQTAEGSADTIFAIGIDNNNWYGFVVENGKLYLQSKINGRKNSATLRYDPTDHRCWRLRHEATLNQILWETSPDGTNWTILRRATPEISLDNIYVSLAAGTYTPEVEPGLAAFDNFKFVIHR